jgi:hypothetical protein
VGATFREGEKGHGRSHRQSNWTDSPAHAQLRQERPEIVKRLKLTSDEVEETFFAAARKLRARTPVHAIVKALWRGVLPPRPRAFKISEWYVRGVAWAATQKTPSGNGQRWIAARHSQVLALWPHTALAHC